MRKTETLDEISAWRSPYDGATVDPDDPAHIADRAGQTGSGLNHGSDALPIPGDYIRHYEIIRELGRGGMGAVYLARDTKLGRRVAVKFLLPKDYRVTDRFLIEAQITAQCMHEHIVVIYEASEYRGNPFMVLEYLEGENLSDYLKGRTVTARRAVELIAPVVRALVHAHSMGIVHRDLKPGNIMLTRTGGIKVLDFGIVKLLTDGSGPAADRPRDSEDTVLAPDYLEVTNTNAFIGTLPYMSPEQINADAIDHRTDIWAVGIMLWEMVTGAHPVGELSRPALMATGNLDVPMPRMSERAPELGPLASIIDRCLVKERDDRTPTAEALLTELEPLISSEAGVFLGDDHSPFAGLAAFQKSDATRFFGRDDDIANVVARIRSDPLTTLVGPSGTGKSSLIRAGVIPALERSGEGWQTLVVRPGRRPVAALATTLAQLSVDSSERRPGTEADDDDNLAERLTAEPGYLGARLRARASKQRRRFLVFVDQFEELYTLGAEPAERAAFVACLEGVADDAASPLRVILSMRSDLLDRVSEDRAFLSEVTRGLVLLPPIGRDGLREALTRPVRAAGYRFEHDDLVSEMVDALDATSGALPLLQFTASRLWEARDRERQLLTRESYEAMGGVAGTLASHADAVLAGLSPSQRRLARSVLERLVTPERTRAIASMRELCELADRAVIERVIHDLADARLVAIESHGERDGGAVELIHESLITGWPTLRRWLDENREDTEFLARLRAAVQQWERSDRQDGALWRGEACRQARQWMTRYTGEVPGRQQAYLDAVMALDARTRRRRRAILIGIVAILAGLVLVATVMLTKLEQLDTIREQEALLQKKQAELVRSLAEEEKARESAETAQKETEAARKREAARASEAEAARDELDKQRAVAVAASQQAIDEQKAAEAARDEAQTEREKADKAREEAERLRGEAVEANKEIDRQRRKIQRLIERQGIEKLNLKKRPGAGRRNQSKPGSQK